MKNGIGFFQRPKQMFQILPQRSYN